MGPQICPDFHTKAIGRKIGLFTPLKLELDHEGSKIQLVWFGLARMGSWVSGLVFNILLWKLGVLQHKSSILGAGRSKKSLHMLRKATLNYTNAWDMAHPDGAKAGKKRGPSAGPIFRPKNAEWDVAHPDGAKAGKRRGPNTEPACTTAGKKSKGQRPTAPPPKPKSAYQIFSAA
eukprot:scaffold231158_cov19-Tisochrysis_lutea.AAC.2